MAMTRRSFGRAGLIALGAGLSRSAWAAEPATARRLVIFFSPNGTVPHRWRPVGTGTGYSFAAGSILEPLTAHRSGLVVVGGVDFKDTSNHEGGMRAMLTGNGLTSHVGAGASIDQYVASQIGGGMAFPSLELGVHTSAWGASVQTRMSYSAPGNFVPPDDDPGHVHSRLAQKLSPVGAALTPAELRRQKVLDLVYQEVTGLRQVVPVAEKARLDQHLDALSAMQSSLAAGGLCGTAGPAPVGTDPASNDAFPAITDAQLSLLVTALSCGLTRVASFQLSHTVGPPVFSWLGLQEGHHSLSHKGDTDPAGVDQYVAAERWVTGRFGALLDALASAPDLELGGNLLDHTLVVWCKEMGDGRLHDCVSVPFVLAGVPSLLGEGRFLEAGGAPHQKLLVSIARLMGLDVMTFGDPSYGTGPLAGLGA